ncbi:RNA polymerase sigma factor [Pedobacter sp. N36a]|uniref:RNA polymerase sigma factor n=1 Tax=Pedobacter sp. N36a TaxID=2767996 RepID=UPI0016575124|nr:RNA polymerase sigma factor [Pedobacter sp. N36a]MBC8985240.1 RNA polymerase sigma factor [Pedobacter sp. N36a]
MLFGRNRKEDHFLKQAILGEREGSEYLVKTYQNLSYTLAIKICGNSEDAEEVVQDAFMKAFKALAGFGNSYKFSSWLYRILYHTALTKKTSRRMVSEELNEQSGAVGYLLGEKKEFGALVHTEFI